MVVRADVTTGTTIQTESCFISRERWGYVAPIAIQHEIGTH